MLALITGPLAISAIAYGFPRTPVFAALERFGREFRVNDPFWTTLDLATGSRLPNPNGFFEGSARCLSAYSSAFYFRRDWRRGVLWVWGALLLLSPVVHAWYAVWVLPVAVWRGSPARPWVVLSVSMFGYFLLWDVNHESGRPWMEPFWLRALIYLPPILALAWTSLCAPLATGVASVTVAPTSGTNGNTASLSNGVSISKRWPSKAVSHPASEFTR